MAIAHGIEQEQANAGHALKAVDTVAIERDVKSVGYPFTPAGSLRDRVRGARGARCPTARANQSAIRAMTGPTRSCGATRAAQPLGLNGRIADTEACFLRHPRQDRRNVMILHLTTRPHLRQIRNCAAWVWLTPSGSTVQPATQPTNADSRSTRWISPCSSKKSRVRYTVGEPHCAGSGVAGPAGRKRPWVMRHPESCRVRADAIPSGSHPDARRSPRLD